MVGSRLWNRKMDCYSDLELSTSSALVRFKWLGNHRSGVQWLRIENQMIGPLWPVSYAASAQSLFSLPTSYANTASTLLFFIAKKSPTSTLFNPALLKPSMETAVNGLLVMSTFCLSLQNYNSRAFLKCFEMWRVLLKLLERQGCFWNKEQSSKTFMYLPFGILQLVYTWVYYNITKFFPGNISSFLHSITL